MNWLLARLQEPTSYAGAYAATMSITNLFNGDFSVQSILGLIFGGLAFALPEATPAISALGNLVNNAVNQANNAQTTANTALTVATAVVAPVQKGG